METFGLVGTLDDLDRLLAHADERRSQFVARVAAIGEHIAQPRKPRPDCGQHVDSSIAILNVGSVNENEDRETASAGPDVPVTALDLLARVKARYSALCRARHNGDYAERHTMPSGCGMPRFSSNFAVIGSA